MIRIINQPCVGVRETFGRFRGVLSPGWHLYLPLITRIHVYDTRQVNLPFSLTAKTRDNVFCTLSLNVVTRVSDPERRHYASSDPVRALSARVEEVVRNAASEYTIEGLFAAQKQLQESTLDRLADLAAELGCRVSSVAITDVVPEAKVRESMNSVNAAMRERQAAAERAESRKVEMVKEAEADAERKRLQGQGIADMRSAIIGGYRDRISEMADSLGITPQQAITITLTTQYVEALGELAKSPNSKVLFYSQDAAHTVQDVTRQFNTLFLDSLLNKDVRADPASARSTTGMKGHEDVGHH